MKKCRMCEKIKETTSSLDGLCDQCHLSLCQKGLGKCVRCAKVVDGIVDLTFGKYEEKENI